MQTDEIEYDLMSNTLNTPSLMTPNIVLDPQTRKPTFPPVSSNVSANHAKPTESDSSSVTTNSEASSANPSADVKVSKIEDELKQSFSEPRRPTPSPFQKISSTSVFVLEKPAAVIINDDGSTIEIPSTADVVKELEALTNTNPFTFQVKTLMNEASERETGTVNGDNVRYDSPPTVNTGVIVSPKKKFLIRSQSHTEPTSPSNNNNSSSQSQKTNADSSISNTQNGFDEVNALDDSVNHSFARLPDMPTVTHPVNTNVNNSSQFKSVLDNASDQHPNMQLRLDQSELSRAMNKQSPVVINNNNKRTFQQANLGNNILSLTKAGTMIIPQASLNEVTSSDLRTTVKRTRTAAMPGNTTMTNFRASYPTSSSAVATHTIPSPTTTNGSNVHGGSEDQRKRQIRDSNREAARRCRERRRQYIEQLEGDLEQCRSQIKQLGEKFARVERENTQLRAFLSEAKLLHPATRLAINDAHVQYANVLATSELDPNGESNHQTDGGPLQRAYVHRNNL